MPLDCKHLKPVKADGEVDTTVNDEKRDPHDSGTDEYNAHLKKDVSGGGWGGGCGCGFECRLVLGGK